MKSAPTILHVGLDVHKETIAVALASGEGSVRQYGDRIKTNARDAEQLARLFRAGELTAVRVPDESDEAPHA